MQKITTILRILWGGMIFEMFALMTIGGLVWQDILPIEPAMKGSVASILFYVFTAMSAVSIIAQQMFLKKRPDLLTTPPDQVEAMKKKRFVFHVIAMALSDSVAVFGFVLLMTTGLVVQSAILAGVGIVTLVLLYPIE